MSEATKLAAQLGYVGIAVWQSVLGKPGYIAATFGKEPGRLDRSSWHPFPTPEEAVDDLAARLEREVG